MMSKHAGLFLVLITALISCGPLHGNYSPWTLDQLAMRQIWDQTIVDLRASGHTITRAEYPQITIHPGQWKAHAWHEEIVAGKSQRVLGNCTVGGLTSSDGKIVELAWRVTSNGVLVATYLDYWKWEAKNSLLCQNGYESEAI